MRSDIRLSDYWIRHYLSFHEKELFLYGAEYRYRISLSNRGLYFILSPKDCFNNNETITLTLQNEGARIKVCDLYGPDRYHRQGCGTALFNLALQVISIIYHDTVDSLVIYGDVLMKSDDDTNAKRVRFWEHFGFKVTDEGRQGFYLMSTKFSELKPRVIEGNPFAVDIRDFRSQSNLISSFHQAQADVKPYYPVALELLAEIKVASESTQQKKTLFSSLIQGITDPVVTPGNIIRGFEREHKGLLRNAVRFLSVLMPDYDEQTTNKLLSMLEYGGWYKAGNREINAYIDFISLFVYYYELAERPYHLRKDLMPAPTQKDFMFGDLDELSYSKCLTLYQQMGKTKFIKHLNRVLSIINKNILPITNSASYADEFAEWLDAIEDEISLIELYRPSFEKTGLHLRIYFDEGILDCQFDWTAWKELRAREIFRDLAPIFQSTLRQKTFLVIKGKRVNLPNDNEALVMTVLDIEGDYFYQQSDVYHMIQHPSVLKAV